METVQMRGFWYVFNVGLLHTFVPSCL